MPRNPEPTLAEFAAANHDRTCGCWVHQNVNPEHIEQLHEALVANRGIHVRKKTVTTGDIADWLRTLGYDKVTSSKIDYYGQAHVRRA